MTEIYSVLISRFCCPLTGSPSIAGPRSTESSPPVIPSSTISSETSLRKVEEDTPSSANDWLKTYRSFRPEDNVYEAEKHFIVGTPASAETLTNLLYTWYTEDEPHTAPSYIARAVFPYLLVGNIRDATRSLQLFTQELIKNNSSLVVQEVQSATTDFRVFPSLPLLNFLGLLVPAVQSGAVDLFKTLKSHYAGNLKEVPAWEEVRFPGEFVHGRDVMLTPGADSRAARRDILWDSGQTLHQLPGHDGEPSWRRRRCAARGDEAGGANRGRRGSGLDTQSRIIQEAKNIGKGNSTRFNR